VFSSITSALRAIVFGMIYTTHSWLDLEHTFLYMYTVLIFVKNVFQLLVRFFYEFKYDYDGYGSCKYWA